MNWTRLTKNVFPDDKIEVIGGNFNENDENFGTVKVGFIFKENGKFIIESNDKTFTITHFIKIKNYTP